MTMFVIAAIPMKLTSISPTAKTQVSPKNRNPVTLAVRIIPFTFSRVTKPGVVTPNPTSTASRKSGRPKFR